MTTKRMSFQLQQQASHHHHHQHHHHAQRRPPDVEEALSSMLWTPYERASTTDTSSDDEDEHLQRQLKKSKSQYDYTSVPTTIPPLTPPPPPLLPEPATLPMPLPIPTALALPTTQFPLPPTHLTPTNIVAYITTATPLRAAAQAAVAATSLLTCTPVRTASAATATSSYYTAEDLCDPSVVTPLVPFSNFMLNAHTMTTTTSTTAANNDIDVDQDQDNDDDDDDVDGNVDTIVHDINVDDTFNDVVYGNENRLAATSSTLAMMSSSYQQKNRYSSSSSSSSFSTFGRIPSLTKWWSTSSNNTQSNTVSIAAQYDNSNATTQLPPASASTLTDEANKQPPSYESLYNKKQHPLRPQRPQQRHSHHSHYRLNKHLNLFKPVLETLKANVTTITQGRFTSLARPDNNCRVTNNTTTTTTTNALNHGPAATLTPILATATATTATEAMGENSNNSTEESASNNLVHSFTDNFLHEHCQTTQHVAGTNVAETNVANNEHIINNNNNNNDTLTTDNNINGETPNQSHERLIHQQQQQQQHTHLQESTNTKSKQNQEHENKQNNNFIISQQQKQQQQQKQEQLLLTITTKENNENKLSDEQTKMNTKTNTVNEQQQQLTTDHREPTMDVFNTTTTTSTTTSMIEESGLLYDSSSAISLTRSFEANTSYTFDCTRTNNANSFNKFSYETRKTNDTSSTTTISNTYNLTPNKCLAELERLYAEFRASESIREQKLREHQNIRLQNAHRRNLKDIATETENMRLNVPASNSANAEFNSRNGVGVVKAVSETKLNPSTSSVFLTTTNSLTTITNPCQRTPSLTIQVNQNQHTNSNDTSTNTNTNPSNNNNHNNNNNNNNINNNNVVASATNTGQHDNDLQQQVFLNQAIVNTTTNGVSVINCNYVNNNNNNNYSSSNSNNNNNNNHNKSITNLQDSVTNSNSKSISNPTSTSTSSASSTTNNLNNNHDPATDHIKSNNNHMPGGVSDNIPNSSVPQVLNASDENPPITNSSPLKQVNVIKVNEHVEKRNNSNASTPAQSPRRRTFTSTECQTDDIASVQLRSPSAGRPPLTSTSSANSTGPPHSTTNNREQRRRERRERRHLQHTASLMVAPTHHSHPHPPHHLRHASLMDRHSMPTPPLPPILHPPHLHLQQAGHHNVAMLRPMLPDILHNHFPPPYSALPPPPPPPTVGSGSVPHHHNGSPLTFSHAPPPPTQNATATILGPPPPPPPAGTTLLTSVISTVPIPGATPMVSDGRFTLPLPIMRRSPSERSGKGCCGQWFAGPPLRALIAVVALGGVACALGGAALGATGLAGPPSSHFTAALLMIGVGVVLVTVSGAAWRMTAPGGPPCLGLGSSVDLGRCGRRPCSRGGGAPQGLLYPEFQHRPPPPSYQASMQEYRLRLLLLDRDRQNGVVRGSSPPPTYRSHAGSLLRAPLTSTIRGTQGHSGGRCESSIGGSEYSFPPSYRSRNTTPGTISSERSIETEPSGRLLANEDIPEPLSVDQLSEYNSLQQRTLNTSNANNQKSEQKRNSIQLDSPDLVTKSEVNLNNLNSSDKKNDLVTIVTITPNSNDIMEVHENCNNVTNGEGYANEDLVRNSESREQIEILAHL